MNKRPVVRCNYSLPDNRPDYITRQVVLKVVFQKKGRVEQVTQQVPGGVPARI